MADELLKKPEEGKPEEKMSLARMLLAAGFMIIMLGVGIGAATDGSVWAKYVALAGVATIGISIVVTVVSKITGKTQESPQQVS